MNANAIYSGQALSSFLRGIPSEDIQRQILNHFGLDYIDEHQWYPFETARGIYYKAKELVGDASLYNIGEAMMTSANFPPSITNVEEVLASLNQAYRLNCEGPDEIIGIITTEFTGQREAVITFKTPFPCPFQRGIITGCMIHFDEMPLIEHSYDAPCIDKGNDACRYQVSW